jgi:hypothetical protein
MIALAAFTRLASAPTSEKVHADEWKHKKILVSNHFRDSIVTAT